MVGLTVSPLSAVSPASLTATAAAPKLGARPQAPSSNLLMAAAALAQSSPFLAMQSVRSEGSAIRPASCTVQQVGPVAPSSIQLSATIGQDLWRTPTASSGRQPPSSMGASTLFPSMVAQLSAHWKSPFTSPPIAAVTLTAYPPAAAQRMPPAATHLVGKPEPEPPIAYYVDSPSDEEQGAAVEAQIDFMMGDLEQLFQEQLVTLVEDIAEHQVARKGKAVATDPSIMVLEEDPTAAVPTRPDELITLQPEGGSRWYVQCPQRRYTNQPPA